MKGLIEGIKDFIYDSIDYIIMLAIVIAVVFVIGWRLDILFAKDNLDNPSPAPIVVDGSDIEDNNNDKDHEDVVDIDDPNSPTEDDSEEDPQGIDIVDNPDTETPGPSPSTVTINIPDGTLPSAIGAILESNGLVTNKNDFVIKAQSMDLDRKLKSGTFQIQDNSSLEEIVKIIARQN